MDTSTGAIDNTWAQTYGGDIHGLNSAVSQLSSDGTNVFAIGSFTGAGGYTTNNIAKISKVTGLPDLTFSPPANNGFNQIASTIELAGQALVVSTGSQTTYRGIWVRPIVYINKDTGALLP